MSVTERFSERVKRRAEHLLVHSNAVDIQSWWWEARERFDRREIGLFVQKIVDDKQMPKAELARIIRWGGTANVNAAIADGSINGDKYHRLRAMYGSLFNFAPAKEGIAYATRAATLALQEAAHSDVRTRFTRLTYEWVHELMQHEEWPAVIDDLEAEGVGADHDAVQIAEACRIGVTKRIRAAQSYKVAEMEGLVAKEHEDDDKDLRLRDLIQIYEDWTPPLSVVISGISKAIRNETIKDLM